MPSVLKRSDFDHATRREAGKGILGQRVRELRKSTVLYRFGNTEARAMGGGWWLEESQFRLAEEWGKQHGLALPLAARVLGAIAHGYGDMRVLVRARVIEPLLAYEGRSRNQLVHVDGKLKEMLNPQDLRNGPKITQLFIPSVRDPEVNRDSLLRLSTERFGAGDSHIGGVTGIPKGAKLQ